jgi:hypothetical protein
VTIAVNNHAVGSVTIDSSGGFIFILSTDQADEGHYFVTLPAAPGVSAEFTLDASAPVQPKEGDGPLYAVPTGIAYSNAVYLPFVRR